MAEEARLESVYTSKAYRGFESPSLRNKNDYQPNKNEERDYACDKHNLFFYLNHYQSHHHSMTDRQPKDKCLAASRFGS